MNIKYNESFKMQAIEKGYRRLDVIEYMKYCEAIYADPAEGLAIIKKYVGQRILSPRQLRVTGRKVNSV